MILIIMLATVFLGLTVQKVFAYTGIQNTMTEKQLYNETNTYNVTEDRFNTSGDIITEVDNNRINNTTQYNISYNMVQKNANLVMETTQLTVLTHGLGSDAGTWSNNYSKTNLSDTFAYDNQSLISNISEKVGGAKIFWAKMSGYKNFNLYDITGQNSTGTTYLTTNVVNQINDISKHIVIVFDANGSEESNNNIYYQFNYVISKIIYDVKIANGGSLPKVNLVGHSRGGLTNLQYALDHPDLVSTLVSLGTPYFSSTTANLFGESLMGAGDGLDDILNPDIYYGYNTRWNSNYNTLYKNIDAYAIGSYHTLTSLAETLSNDCSGLLPDWSKPLISVGLGALNGWKLSSFSTYIMERVALATITEILDIMYPDSQVVDVAEILFQEINYDVYPMFVSWYNDILVNLESQLGSDTGSVGYQYSGSFLGFNRVTRPFLMFDDYVDYEKVSQASVPVGHNLVARDQLVLAEVVSVLDLGVNTNSAYVTIENDDGTITFVRYRGEYIGSTFYVPETIDGKTVTEISAFAFDGETGITEIVLPNTIKKISAYAFAGLENLTTITFASGGQSQLGKIGYAAFAGCDSLTQFNSSTIGELSLPTSVEFIDCYAFYGTGFTTINLGENINYIGDVAFANIVGLNNISVSGNSMYFSSNGALFNSNGWLMQYPIGKSNSSYTIPSSVSNVAIRHISQFAFMGENSLTTINLNNVISIDSYAFMGCTSLSTFNNASNIEYVGAFALDDTQIMIGTQNFITLGKVLYKYNGTASILNASDFPTVLYSLAKYKAIKDDFIDDFSSLTHGHDIAKTACKIYANVAKTIIDGDSNEVMRAITETYNQEVFDRLKSPNFYKLHEDEIQSSGYVVDTLEAALWCLLNTGNYKNCMLKAVNLGGDTDTIAAVAGGLAGLCYGKDSIPTEWLETLRCKEMIDELIEQFYNKIK